MRLICESFWAMLNAPRDYNQLTFVAVHIAVAKLHAHLPLDNEKALVFVLVQAVNVLRNDECFAAIVIQPRSELRVHGGDVHSTKEQRPPRFHRSHQGSGCASWLQCF